MKPALIEPLETRYAPAAVSISVISNANANEGDQITFRVSIDEVQDTDVVVNFVALGGTALGQAQEGADFTFTDPSPATIPAGAQFKDFSVLAVQDGLYEFDESFSIKLTGVDNGVVMVGAQDTATATILANDQVQKPTVSVGPDVSLPEGNSGTTPFPFLIRLDKPSGVPVSVHVFTQDDSGSNPADASDYASVIDDIVTFAPGETEKTYNINVTGDTTSEPNETFKFKIGNVSEDAILGADTAIGTIQDDEMLNITIDPPESGPVQEGPGKTITFKVHLSSAPTQEVTVVYSTVNGTAIGGQDFNALSNQTLSFLPERDDPSNPGTTLPAETEKTITITILDDTIYEQSEDFTVHLVTSNIGTITTADASGTITDNDAPPVVTIKGPAPDLQTGTITIDEADSSRANIFTLSLDHASSTPITVHISSSQAGDTHLATVGTDYLAVDQDITFAAGETTKTFTLNVLGDTIDEFSEALTLTATSKAGVVQLPADPTVVFLRNDDVKIQVSDASIVEGNTGTPKLAFTVTLSQASSHDVSVNFATADGTAVSTGSSASGGQDYNAATGTLTFAAGETQKTILIDINPDTYGERDEFFKLNFSNPQHATLTKTSVTGTIQNDDDYLSISDAQVIEGGAGTSKVMTFTVTLVRGVNTQGAIKMNYQTADISGSATAGSDYTAIPSTLLTFAANETVKTISVTVLGDSIDESTDEKFNVVLSNVSNVDHPEQTFSTAGSRLTGVGTIIDDENLLTVSNASIVEGDSGTLNMVFTVNLVNRVGSGTVTVNFATANGTAIAGSDYSTTSGSLTFSSTETTKTVVVPILGDVVREGDETFSLNFSNPVGASLATTSVTGTIIDNDPLPSFSITGGTVAENGGSLVFTINLSGPSQTPVSVTFNTADGTAKLSNNDYTATSTTLSFAPGQTSTTVLVPITGDSTIEGDETVLGLLSSAQGATIGTASAAGTIRDDDILVSLSTADLAAPATEGNTGTTVKHITVNLDHAPITGIPVTVSFSVTAGTATAGTDYVAPTINTLTFNPGETSKTIDITIKGDNVDEDDETLVVALTGSTNASLGTPSSGTVTIADDDNTPTLSIADATLTEGNSGNTPMNFTVTLSNPSSKTITVYAKTVPGTALANTDYIALSETVPITFQPGETSKTLPVSIMGDTDDEPTETFQVQLFNPTNATLGDGDATGTIVDNDLRSLSISDMTVTEGNSGDKVMTFTVTLSASPKQTVNVRYATEDDTAKAGEDYVAQSNVLTFAANATGDDLKQTISITIHGDTTIEPDEYFLVRLSADSVQPLNAIISDNIGVGTIQTDETTYALGTAVVSANEENASGGDNTMTFTVTRSGDLSLPGAVKIKTVDDTAVSTGLRPDFVAASSTLFFAANEQTKTFSVTLKHDFNYENDETFKVKLEDAANGNGTIDSAQSTQTGKILNNDDRPKVEITDAPATLEGNLNGTNKLSFTVKLVAADGSIAADETQTVTVNYHTIGKELDATYTARGAADATFAQDYDTTSAGVLTFTPTGAASQVISVPITGDEVDENDETMAVKITSAAGATPATNLVLKRDTGTGIILDDDDAPFVVFGGSSSNGDYSVTEGSFGDSNFNPVLKLVTTAGGKDIYSEKDITFTLTVVPGTATLGTDYTFSGPSAMTITIPAGTKLQTLNFGIIADTIREANETFSFKLSNPHNVRFSDTTSLVTIVDDDPIPTLTIDSPTIVEGDSGQSNMVFTVTLQGTADKAITVKYATADGTGATPAVSVGGLPDYVPASGTLTFAPGETVKTISVPIYGDQWLENNETFTMTLSGATNANIGTATGTGTIQNGDDSVVGIIVQDTSSVEDPFTVNSDGSTTQVSNPTINFKVELTKAIDTAVTFYAQTRNGTAIATGLSDADYVALQPTQYTIAAGQTSTTVQVALKTDFVSSSQNGIFEPTENFFLGIGSPSSNAGIARQEARGTIFNDDFVFIDSKTLLYVDEDGDLATVKISKGAFSAASITFGRINQSTGGRTLQLIDFTGNPKLFNGTDLIVTVEPQIGFAASGKTTDGEVDIGFIRGAIPDTETLQFSHGIDFRNIVVPGDVAKITAGDNFTTPSIIGGIKVKSLGTRTDTGAPNVTSQFLSTVNSLQVEGDVMGIVQVLGNQFGNINSLKIGGALRGAETVTTQDDAPTGVIAFTGTLKSATIGNIIGGGARDSGSITAYTDFTARIGSLHVLGDVVGGKGTRSGGVVAKSIGSVTVDGSIIGGGDTGTDIVNGTSTSIPKGSNSGVIRSLTTIGTVLIEGDVKGGIQSTTGLVVAGGKVNAIHLGGSLLGGSGSLDAGAIVVGQNLTTLVIDGDIIGSSGERSATVQVGTAQNFSTTPTFSIFIKNLTVGSADGTGGDVRGGSGVDSGTITSGAGFSSAGFSVRGGTIGNALIYGDIIGGTGEGGTSTRTGDSSGGVQAGSTITKLDVRGSIIGGDSPGATATVTAADLVRSGFVVAGRIAQMIVGGDLVAGHDFGSGIADSGSIRARNDIASLIIRGNVIGNETNAAVISAGGNGPVVNGKTSPAIGSLTLGSSTTNSVSFLNVLAGYSPAGTVAAPLGAQLTADVQIGTVNIKGDMKATNIAAGAAPGTDGSFGTGDDASFTASTSVVNNSKILSSIAKVIVGGNVLASDDTYGIVAQVISSVTVQGAPVTLMRGASNDFTEVEAGSNVMVNEVE